MKKAFKVIWIYFGVVVLALLAALIFCAAFLFFYREGNIFGIQYISKDEYIYAKEEESMLGLQNIEIDSGSFEVYIRVNPSATTLMGAMRNKVFGYVKKSKAQASFVLEYDETRCTAVFTAVQPEGWLNKSKSFVEIAIPEGLADVGVNVKIKTTKGDIQIGGDYKWTIGNLNIETDKGDALVTNITLTSSINVDIGSGSVYIDKNCSTSTDVTSNINVVSGTINFAKINVDNFKFGVIEIESIKRGRIGIIKTGELVTNGNINGGGSIEVGQVGFVDFTSLDTDISIDKIEGINASIINVTGLGDVWINEAKCDLEINGHNGDVYINTAMSPISILTNQGDIKMGNALKLVSTVTSYGNIEIKFNELAFSYATGSENRAVFATTKNGHIVVNGLENGHIEATGTGRITLNYNKILGENEILSQSGIVDIVVPNPASDNTSNEYAFNLSVNSSINSDVKVGIVGSIGAEYNGKGLKEFTNIYNSGASTSNNLKVVSTKSMIKIRSRDLVNY